MRAATRADSIRSAADDDGGQRDQQGPRGERVDIEYRDAEYPVADVEQVQQRIVEQQAAQQENRDQALSVDAGSGHDGARRWRAWFTRATRLRRSVPLAAAISRDFRASKRLG